MPYRAGYRLKMRLYSIIAFLGLLPMLGAALALVATEVAGHDDAELDRAAPGRYISNASTASSTRSSWSRAASTCPQIGWQQSPSRRISFASSASFKMSRG